MSGSMISRAVVMQMVLTAAAPDLQEPSEGECFNDEEAAWAIKKWILTEVPEEGVNKATFKYFDTDLTFVKTERGPSWYVVGGGWQGAFYYETASDDDDDEDRPGAYLYPDYRTAVVGIWDNHLLVNGRATTVGQACKGRDSWTLKFGELEGPHMKYSPPSHFSLGTDPLVRDPYESSVVEVRKSMLAGAEDGLFAVRNVMSGEMIAFYSGYIIHCDVSLRSLDRRDLPDSEEHRRNMYNIAIDIEDENYCIDIPPSLGNDVHKYNATLGHKVNHSFTPNSEFVLFTVHPVLGSIMGLAALQDIAKDEEVTVDYGYNYTAESDQPEWFIQQWRSHYNKHQEL